MSGLPAVPLALIMLLLLVSPPTGSCTVRRLLWRSQCCRTAGSASCKAALRNCRAGAVPAAESAACSPASRIQHTADKFLLSAHLDTGSYTMERRRRVLLALSCISMIAVSILQTCRCHSLLTSSACCYVQSKTTWCAGYNSLLLLLGHVGTLCCQSC